MSFAAAGWARSVDIGRGAAPAMRKAILLCLAEYADHQGVCWPGQETIASAVGLSIRAIRDHLNWLEESGLISRSARSSRKGRRSDIYLLHVGVTHSIVMKTKAELDEINDLNHAEFQQPADSAGGEICRSVPAKSAGCTKEEESVIGTCQGGRSKKKKIEPPTKEQWMAFCHEKWPWWPKQDIESAFDYYDLGKSESGEWLLSDGSKVKVWGRCAATCHGNYAKANQAAIRDWKRKQTIQAPVKMPDPLPLDAPRTGDNPFRAFLGPVDRS